MSDGSIHPGMDPDSNETAGYCRPPIRWPAATTRNSEFHIACHACPGYGSCGGMFTYNTMQTFIGVVGMQPLEMVAPPVRRSAPDEEFPEQLVGYLQR